jgi:transcriptional antiterminator
MEGVLKMSQREADRLQIISQISGKTLAVKKGAELIGLCARQVYRILKKITEKGSKGIIHTLHRKKSNGGYSESIRNKVIKIYGEQYSDYGPTLFTKMLLEYHKITINHETVRRWLRANAITTSIRKARPHKSKRERRSCFGELLQFDGRL